jgi:hypothetical protein
MDSDTYDENEYDAQIDSDEEEYVDPIDRFISCELDYVLDVYHEILDRFPYIEIKNTEFVQLIMDIVLENKYSKVRLYEDNIKVVLDIINNYLRRFKKSYSEEHVIII